MIVMLLLISGVSAKRVGAVAPDSRLYSGKIEERASVYATKADLLAVITHHTAIDLKQDRGSREFDYPCSVSPQFYYRNPNILGIHNVVSGRYVIKRRVMI